MDTLMNNEGTLLTKDVDIINELHTFYKDLFIECPCSPKAKLAIVELLKHIVNHIDRKTKKKLEEAPLLEEITNTLRTLPITSL